MAKNKKRLLAKVSKKQFIQQLRSNPSPDVSGQIAGRLTETDQKKSIATIEKTAAINPRMVFAFGLATVATASIYLLAERYNHYQAIGNWIYHGLRLDS